MRVYLYFLYYTVTGVLPFIPLVLLWRVAAMASMQRRGLRTTPLHELSAAMWGAYLLLVVQATVNLYSITRGHFWLSSRYNAVPFQGIADVVATGDFGTIAYNLAGNILLFAPFGFLLPLLWQRRATLVRTVGTAALLSAGIELLQLFTGRIADVDDLILNTLGALVGYLLFLAMDVMFPQVVAQFRCTYRCVRLHPDGRADEAHPLFMEMKL